MISWSSDMLRAVCCCVLLDLICSRCVVNKSGTMTFCSSLGQSQCMTSDGLCSWDASLALSPLATHGCKYLYYMNSSGTDLYQDEKVACSLLQTKETCQSAGRSIGNFGCQWWDVDQCSTENQTNQTTVFKPFWGCKSQATCEKCGWLLVHPLQWWRFGFHLEGVRSLHESFAGSGDRREGEVRRRVRKSKDWFGLWEQQKVVRQDFRLRLCRGRWRNLLSSRWCQGSEFGLSFLCAFLVLTAAWLRFTSPNGD